MTTSDTDSDNDNHVGPKGPEGPHESQTRPWLYPSVEQAPVYGHDLKREAPESEAQQDRRHAQQLDILTSELAEANRILDDTRIRLSTAIIDLTQTRAENGDLRAALQNTRIELVAAQNSRDDAVKELGAVNRELVDAVQDYNDAITARDALERDLEAAARDLKTAKDQSRRADNTINQWRTAYDIKADQLTQIQADFGGLLHERDEANRERDEANTQLREGLMKIEQLQFGERLARKALEALTEKFNAVVVDRSMLIDHHATDHHATPKWWHFWNW